jgi:hypothetical protein
VKVPGVSSLIRIPVAVINSVIAFVWWLVFNPGFYSRDSFAVLEMARTGNISSEWTAPWALLVRILTLDGAHPELATLFFSQILTLSLSIFALTLFEKNIAWLSTVLIMLSPLGGAMGITLWHDIPMTAGFLFFIAGFVRCFQKKAYGILLMIAGAAFSSFRYNGLPTLILMALIFLVVNRKFRVVLAALAILFGVILSTSILNTQFAKQINVQSDGITLWMKYDLSCYAGTSNDDTFFEKQFYGKVSRIDWADPSACTWFRMIANVKTSNIDAEENFIKAWKNLAFEHPGFVLSTHVKRNEYLVPLPINGFSNPPFIHSIIEVQNQGVEFWNLGIAEPARAYVRIWNLFNWFFGYSGFWMLLIGIFAYIRKNLNYWLIFIMALTLNSSLFVFAVISDGRYALPVLLSGQLILLAEIISSKRVQEILRRFTINARTS